MESNCGVCLLGAIVPCWEHRGRMLLRPYMGVRQWPPTFIRPRNVFRLRRISDRRYCSLPGTWGGVCNTPLHGRPTMAADVHSPPECFPIRAPDAHSPLSETILWADDTHSPLKCFPMGAADVRAPLSECPTGAAGIWAPLSECPTGAAGAQTPSKWFPTGRLFAQTPPKWFPMGRLFAQTPPKWFPTGRLFAQTPHLCIFLTASGAWWLPVDRARTARTDPRPAMGKRK